jgi:hypothetical protein
MLSDQEEDYVAYRTKKVVELRDGILKIIPKDFDPAVLVICFAVLIENIFDQELLEDHEEEHALQYIREHILGE